MVASPPPRRLVAVAAFLVCVLMLLPAAPPAQAQSTLPTQMSLSIVSGSAQLVDMDHGGVATQFFDANASAQFRVTVSNSGAEGATVPVYLTLDATTSTSINSCILVPIAAASGNSAATTPISFPFHVPSNATDVNKHAWNATIWVNRHPNSTFSYAPCQGHDASYEYHGNVNDPTNSGVGASDPGPSATNGITPADDLSRHAAWIGFVRDLKIDYRITSTSWCRGDLTADGDPPLVKDCLNLTASSPFNVTASTKTMTFFEAAIQNFGNWTGDADPRGNAWQIPYTATVAGANVALADATAKPAIADHSGAYLMGSFDLNGKIGNYTATLRLNANNALAKAVAGMSPAGAANRTNVTHVQVAWYDLAPSINATDFGYDGAHAYPAEFGSLVIGGHVGIRNNGPAHAGGPDAVHLRAWIDDRNGDFTYNFSDGTDNPLGFRDVGNWSTPTLYLAFNFTKSAQSDKPDSPQYLGPGIHTLYVEADDATVAGDGSIIESNESNNVASIPLYVGVKSGVKPTFNDGPWLTAQVKPYDPTTNPQITGAHPHQNFTINVDVTEGPKDSQADTQDLVVTANFTLATNSSIYQRIPLVYQASSNYQSAPQWVRVVDNLSYVGNGSSEDWKLTIEAVDAFNQTVEKSWNQTFHLAKWPIQTVNDTDILRGIKYNGVRNTTAPQDLNYTVPFTSIAPYYDIQVWRDWTGYIDNVSNQSDQVSKVDNLALVLSPPRHGRNITSGFTSGGSDCKNAGGGVGQTPPDGNPWNGTVGVAGTTAAGCGTSASSRYNFTSATISTTEDGPGTWGVDIQITDISGETRHIFRNLTLQDQLPAFQDLSVSDVTDKAHFTNSSVPGHAVQIHVNVSDDSSVTPPSEVYSVWTRKGHADPTFNFTLRNGTAPCLTGDSSRTCRIFNDTFAVGRGHALNASGTFEVTFVAKDVNGNWGASPPVEFSLNETTNPTITDRGVDPPQQELRQPVTFYAKVSALYDPRVEVTVTDQNDAVIVDAQPMNVTDGLGNDENFTYTTTFNTSGTYSYTIRAFSSQGLLDGSHGVLSGAFSVSENLGPRIEVKSPTVKINGQFYAPAAPTLTFLVYDAQGVDDKSFNLSVDGATVNGRVTTSPAPAGLNGYFFQYTVANVEGQRFQDGQVVPVNLSVFDLTGLQAGKTSLPSYLNFTFVVDAKPPSARITDFAPRYKSGASQLWNVSLSTKFTITASPDDDSPVPVDRVVYTIVGGGRAVTATYNGPFSLADNKEVYAGATVYTISVWAYDAVGNSNATRPNQYSFFLDDAAPHLALPLIQDRWLNFTIVDEQTGVKSATIWARADNEPYQPYPMVKDAVGDVWRGVLPEGHRGQTLTYYVQAVDNVDNNADGSESFGSPSQPYGSLKVANHDPVVKVTSPVVGSRVSRVVDLTWDASDADQDPLTFTLFYKAPGKDAYTELAKLDATGARKYSLDTSKLAGDGEYTFRVTASDGTTAKFDETTVNVINAGSAIGSVGHVDDVVPGDQVVITAQISKAGATVEAQLYRGGALVDSYVMHDDGKDGDKTANDQIYSARVPVSSSGDYSVTIVAHYSEDGQTKESTLVNAASFSAKLTPAYVFATYAGLLVLLALLAVVGIAIAIFVVVKRKG